MDIHDTAISDLIAAETTRQREGLEMIASENYPNRTVLNALGSIASAKYAEGYPGKRYYAGNEIIDKIEQLAIDRAKKLFGAEHVNVQPYSGSPSNLAVYVGLLELGDTIMGLSLTHGGHLTHGHKVSFTGKAFNAVQYEVNADTGLIDYRAVAALARAAKPKLIISGTTAYPRIVDWQKMQAISQEVGALHMVDMSHVAGLVAAGVVPNPVPYADVVTTTTHKTLRGPRGAMILCKAEHAKAIDRAVFPGLQGGPHENTIAAIAVALHQAAQPDFKEYGRQVVANARALAEHLQKDFGYKLVSGGTDTHLLLVDLTNKGISGSQAEDALSRVSITVNKNTIPGETRSPMDPSGIRIGLAALTSRGVVQGDMQKIADWINTALSGDSASELDQVRGEVQSFAKGLPLPGVDS
ncbi:MAG: serine hydroxymethyltransferase [bacterium]|nr:serine hydroxymethyltransferase [bacterium]